MKEPSAKQKVMNWIEENADGRLIFVWAVADKLRVSKGTVHIAMKTLEKTGRVKLEKHLGGVNTRWRITRRDALERLQEITIVYEAGQTKSKPCTASMFFLTNLAGSSNYIADTFLDGLYKGQTIYQAGEIVYKVRIQP